MIIPMKNILPDRNVFALAMERPRAAKDFIEVDNPDDEFISDMFLRLP